MSYWGEAPHETSAVEQPKLFGTVKSRHFGPEIARRIARSKRSVYALSGAGGGKPGRYPSSARVVDRRDNQRARRVSLAACMQYRQRMVRCCEVSANGRCARLVRVGARKATAPSRGVTTGVCLRALGISSLCMVYHHSAKLRHSTHLQLQLRAVDSMAKKSPKKFLTCPWRVGIVSRYERRLVVCDPQLRRHMDRAIALLPIL